MPFWDLRFSYSLSSFPTGRGLKSHAYIHSVQFSHHVFLNLHTLKFYCLPDNYEIIDSSLEDITVCVQDGWFGTSSLGSLSRASGDLPHPQGRISVPWACRGFFLFGRNQGSRVRRSRFIIAACGLQSIHHSCF